MGSKRAKSHFFNFINVTIFFFFFFYKTMMTSKESWHNAEFKKEKKCASMFYYGKSDNFQILFFITIEIDQMSLPANFSKVLL